MRLVLALVPALALALALATPFVEASVAMPRLAVGDAWEERTTQGGANVSTSITKVESRETLDGVDAWRIVSRMAFERRDTPDSVGITNGTSTLWVRASDGALMRQAVRSTFGAFEAPAAGYRWDPPCVQHQWPLEDGTAWEVRCTSTASDGQRYQGDDRRSVVREENVTVPAGTFRALVVDTRDAEGALTLREWVAEGACAPVRSESPQPEGVPPIVRELTGQGCAALAKATPGPGFALAFAAAAAALALARRR